MIKHIYIVYYKSVLKTSFKIHVNMLKSASSFYNFIPYFINLFISLLSTNGNRLKNNWIVSWSWVCYTVCALWKLTVLRPAIDIQQRREH